MCYVKLNTKAFNSKSTADISNLNDHYLTILSACLVYNSISAIQQELRAPIMYQIRALCTHGLLDRYNKKDDSKLYYKTTFKGAKFLERALKI